jgi:hypothetical protein
METANPFSGGEVLKSGCQEAVFGQRAGVKVPRFAVFDKRVEGVLDRDGFRWFWLRAIFNIAFQLFRALEISGLEGAAVGLSF